MLKMVSVIGGALERSGEAVVQSLNGTLTALRKRVTKIS